MSRASRLSGFTTAISGDTDLNVGIVTATQINVDESFTFADINVTGVATANNLNVTGVSTLSNVVVGGATTELVVTGDARITGILTVGTSSLTLNGTDGTISGISTINGISYPSTGALSNRNLIINGAMTVAQRGTIKTNVTSFVYRCDRFLFAPLTLGTWTVEQSTDAPTGFANSLKATCTTADASPAANDYCLISYRGEARDFQLLNYGTSNAEQVVISFYVKSNKTGSASFGMYQNDSPTTRQFTKAFLINAADTWEYKTIVIPGDTSGQIDNDNDKGITLDWWLNSGSTYTGGSHSAGWEVATQVNRNASNLGVGGATSDYFQLTGVQLEVGTQATPFEHRSYGDEIVRCQRYYQHFASGGGGTATNSNQTASAQCGITFATEMREAPSITVGAFNNSDNCNGTVISNNINKHGVNVQPQSSASGRQYWYIGLSTASAEL